MSNITHTKAITIRSATSEDGADLVRLAQRDSSSVPAGRLLVADDGESILAALAVDSGRVIADPFEPTAELVEMMRIRAAHHRRRHARMRIVARSHPERGQRIAA
jgi:hypothetical protein